MKGFFKREHMCHLALERHCTEVTKGSLLKISVYEDGQESCFITLCSSAVRGPMSLLHIKFTSHCFANHDISFLNSHIKCCVYFFKAQLKVNINLIVVCI